jgi:hypothetical protein
MIDIKSNDRLFITGKTSSGKSIWICSQLPQIERFVFYDPKHEHDNINAVMINTLEDLRTAIKQHPKISFRPYLIDDNMFDELCRLIWNIGNTLFIIDETAFHVESFKIMPYHSLLQRLGRKRGIGVWNCTQRPRTAHNTLLSEVDHVISFKLMLKTDRDKLAGSYDPLFDKANELKEFHYIYYNTKEDNARICEPVPYGKI